MPDDDDRDERDDDNKGDDDADEDDDGGEEEPKTIEAARERIAVLERELASTRRESIKRRDRIRGLEADLAKEREQHMGEAERAVEQARREEREKLEGEHQSERVRSAVLLAASTRLRDPQDAIRYVDLDALGSDDGDLTKAAERAVEELVSEKDYLAREAEEPPSGARSPGPRQRQGSGTRPRETDVNARIRRNLRR
jgi:hypothetical protein